VNQQKTIVTYNSQTLVSYGTVNGGTVFGPLTVTGYPNSVVNSLSIGNWNGTNLLNGWMKKLTYYPQALPSSQLQTLTGY
jgi:hypothetical protein